MNILDTIGHTPLIFLDSVSAHLPAKIHVKYEARNPGGSIKDRAARSREKFRPFRYDLWGYAIGNGSLLLK